MNCPDVSVIITNYNYSSYLDRCIRSCLKQSNINHEVVLVDDCSTDNSEEIVAPFLNQIVYLKTKENVGVAEAANFGIKKARSRFFIRVDADDFISPDTCYFMWYYMIKNRKVLGVACDYVLINDYEEKTERVYSDKKPISCGIMYRKDLFIKAGMYNPAMRHREEEELRKRLGEEYTIDRLHIPFYRYRMHDNNKTKEPEYKTWKV